MHVNTTMCVDRGGKGKRARHVIGLRRERKVERRGGHQWEKALSSLSDVFKDNEPHPLHSVLTLTHCTRTHTHQVKHLKAYTQCRHTHGSPLTCQLPYHCPSVRMNVNEDTTNNLKGFCTIASIPVCMYTCVWAVERIYKPWRGNRLQMNMSESLFLSLSLHCRLHCWESTSKEEMFWSKHRM